MRVVSKLWLALLAVGGLVACPGPQPDASEASRPEVTWEVPEQQAVLSGYQELMGRASAEAGVFKVELQVDGAEPVLASGADSWSFRLDTLGLANGDHTLTAVVTDRKGQTASAERRVTITNVADVAVSEVALSATDVDTWTPVMASVTLTNRSVGPVRLQGLVLRARPAGAQVPVVELGAPLERITMDGNGSYTLTARHAFSPLLPLGAWEVVPVWRDPGTREEHTGTAATLQVRRALHLGAALHNGRLFDVNEPEYQSTFLAHFDGFTPEFEMKWAQVQPQQGVFTYATVDRMLAFAEAHGKRVRGHVLAWHKSLPGWMTSRTWTREEAIALLEDYIAHVMGRYKGRILEWDVVNEAFNDDGTWRKGIWYDAIGPDYIEIAFRAAHAADPSARLYYNDYSAERVGTKSNVILTHFSGLKAKGVPVHGVGFQAHFSGTYSATQAQLEQNLARFHSAGFLTHITEMDVRTSALSGTDTEKWETQADIYRGVAQACVAQMGCTGMTTWGFTDKYTWLGTAEMPLPFDTNYSPKPSFTALQQTLQR